MSHHAKRRIGFTTVLAVLVAIAAIPPDRGPFVADGYTGWSTLALPAEVPLHEVLLVGDTGAPERDPLEPVLRVVQQAMRQADGRATAVFLGDNLYPRGLPPPENRGYADAAGRLMTQLEAMRGLPGRVLFVPGNHDWNHGGPEGADFVARQQALVVSVLGSGAFPVPAGRPGPVVVPLDSALTLVLLDTAWYLYPLHDDEAAWRAERDRSARALADTLAAYGSGRLVVAGHHPLYSNGQHSGRYPFRSHVFPLIELRRWAFVPLPVLGTLAFKYVEHNGLSTQDLGHPRYRSLRQTLAEAFAPHDGLIYAAGHDHNLQYFPLASGAHMQHAIVSGGGAEVKTEEVVPGHGQAFGYAHSGLAHLRFYRDGQAFMDFVIPKNGGNNAVRVFRSRLR